MQVRGVHAPLDAVALARENPQTEVIFFGVGFETTMPATAVAVKLAAAEGLENFSVFSVHKTMPAALQVLLGSGNVRVSGLLLPGHVTTVVGPDTCRLHPPEISPSLCRDRLRAHGYLVGSLFCTEANRPARGSSGQCHTRAVKAATNPRARALLAEVFKPEDAAWRRLGGDSGKRRQPPGRVCPVRCPAAFRRSPGPGA